MIDRFVVPVVAGIFIVVAWPLAICFVLYSYIRKPEPAQDATSHKPDGFKIETRHLLENVRIEEIKIREIMKDPLNAVPHVPFGHLHPVWTDFYNQIKANDEIWSFQADWGPYGTPTERRLGYVIVRDGIIGAAMVSSIAGIERNN